MRITTRAPNEIALGCGALLIFQTALKDVSLFDLRVGVQRDKGAGAMRVSTVSMPLPSSNSSFTSTPGNFDCFQGMPSTSTKVERGVATISSCVGRRFSDVGMLDTIGLLIRMKPL